MFRSIWGLLRIAPRSHGMLGECSPKQWRKLALRVGSVCAGKARLQSVFGTLMTALVQVSPRFDEKTSCHPNLLRALHTQYQICERICDMFGPPGPGHT